MATIMVIDDDRQIRQLVKNILRRKTRHSVLEAETGAGGMDKARTVPPDLILLDIGLPDLDGFEVCRRLKANPQTCRIPVVMLTNSGRRDDVINAYASGANDYVVKPFEFEIFLSKLIKCLQPVAAGSGKTGTPSPELRTAVKPVAGEKQPAAAAQPSASPAAVVAATPVGSAAMPVAGAGGGRKKSLRSQVAERKKKRGDSL